MIYILFSFSNKYSCENKISKKVEVYTLIYVLSQLNGLT